MTQALTRFDGAPGFAITPVGLRITGTPSMDEAAIFGAQLARVEHAVQFAIGAFASWAEQTFGEMASQLIDPDFGWSLDSIRNYKWVHENVPEDVRQPGLSFKHHQVVARLSQAQQRKYLTMACGVDGEPPWPVSRLSAAIRTGEDAVVTSVWLVVLCKDRADLEALQTQLEAKGRTCKVVEKRERPAKRPKKAITARARNPKKRRARSRG